MRALVLAALVAAAVASTAAARASTAAHAPLARKFFNCPSEYAFQLDGGSAARCYKAASEKHAALAACLNTTIPGLPTPIGTFAKADYKGSEDYCVGQATIAGFTNVAAFVRTCPSGWSKRVQSGTDVCYQTIPEESVAPTQVSWR